MLNNIGSIKKTITSKNEKKESASFIQNIKSKFINFFSSNSSSINEEKNSNTGIMKPIGSICNQLKKFTSEQIDIQKEKVADLQFKIDKSIFIEILKKILNTSWLQKLPLIKQKEYLLKIGNNLENIIIKRATEKTILDFVPGSFIFNKLKELCPLLFGDSPEEVVKFQEQINEAKITEFMTNKTQELFIQNTEFKQTCLNFIKESLKLEYMQDDNKHKRSTILNHFKKFKEKPEDYISVIRDIKACLTDDFINNNNQSNRNSNLLSSNNFLKYGVSMSVIVGILGGAVGCSGQDSKDIIKKNFKGLFGNDDNNINNDQDFQSFEQSLYKDINNYGKDLVISEQKFEKGKKIFSETIQPENFQKKTIVEKSKDVKTHIKPQIIKIKNLELLEIIDQNGKKYYINIKGIKKVVTSGIKAIEFVQANYNNKYYQNLVPKKFFQFKNKQIILNPNYETVNALGTNLIYSQDYLQLFSIDDLQLFSKDKVSNETKNETKNVIKKEVKKNEIKEIHKENQVIKSINHTKGQISKIITQYQDGNKLPKKIILSKETKNNLNTKLLKLQDQIYTNLDKIDQNSKNSIDIKKDIKSISKEFTNKLKKLIEETITSQGILELNAIKDFPNYVLAIKDPKAAINEIAHKQDIDPKVIANLFDIESKLDPLAISNSNSKGLGQLQKNAIASYFTSNYEMDRKQASYIASLIHNSDLVFNCGLNTEISIDYWKQLQEFKIFKKNITKTFENVYCLYLFGPGDGSILLHQYKNFMKIPHKIDGALSSKLKNPHMVSVIPSIQKKLKSIKMIGFDASTKNNLTTTEISKISQVIEDKTKEIQINLENTLNPNFILANNQNIASDISYLFNSRIEIPADNYKQCENTGPENITNENITDEKDLTVNKFIITENISKHMKWAAKKHTLKFETLEVVTQVILNSAYVDDLNDKIISQIIENICKCIKGKISRITFLEKYQLNFQLLKQNIEEIEQNKKGNKKSVETKQTENKEIHKKAA